MTGTFIDARHKIYRPFRSLLTGLQFRATDRRMWKFILPLLVLLPACSSLPVPGSAPVTGDSATARQLLVRSSAASGDPWEKLRKVDVAYAGKWSGIAAKIQPVLVDAMFRKSSAETYLPGSRRVRQVHTGPGGTKQVLRTPGSIEVRYGGVRNTDQDVNDAAAMVADAYTIFLFGPSYLKTRATGLGMVGSRKIGGEICDGIQGTLRPGIGRSGVDRFIVWIGRDSSQMRQFQFSIDGFTPTRGADVEVTFSEHWKAVDGTIWPRHFVERIVRPIPVQAHDWRMLSLVSERN